MEQMEEIQNEREVYLQEFLCWKQAQGVSQKTLEDYSNHVKRFFKRFPYGWNPELLKKSIYTYMGENIKPATYNLRLIYLRAFFEWCLGEGYLTKNPLTGFKRRKAPGRVVDISQEILQQLLGYPDTKTYSGLRDLALMMLTLDTGIRPGEAFLLKEDDFDSRNLLIHIPEKIAKTRTGRHLPILLITAECIRKLISARPKSWGRNVNLFSTSDGRIMSRHTWNDRLKLYSKKIGTKIRPYDLRHSFALIYLRNGGHAFGLQHTLGHTDIQMTKRYVNLTGQDLKDSHTKASPLNILVSQKNKRMRKLKNVE